MNSGRAPAAVLWDMDGTLVDTEPYWFEAERAIVDAHGNGIWPDELAHAMIGFDLLDSAAFMQRHGAVDLAATDIVDRLLELVIEQLDVAIPWRPGARELLDSLGDHGVPCALVTMSWRSFADAVLAHLPDRFVASITGDEVPDGSGKPDPTPYLLGAAAVGHEPDECVAIEDSVTGVTSAHRAGCRVLAVPNAFVTIEPSAGVTIRNSLAGVTVGDLAKL